MSIRSAAGLLVVLAVLSLPAAAADGVMSPDEARAALRDSKRHLEADPTLRFDPTTVLVAFDPAAPAEARSAALAAIDGRIIRTFRSTPGLVHVKIRGAVTDALAVLSLMPDVVYAEPDYVVRTQRTPNDPYFAQQWGLHNTGQTISGDPGVSDADIDAPAAWDSFTGSSTFVVAIIDTGLQGNHEDLAANVWTNPGEIAGNGIDDDGNGYVDDVRGYDFYDNKPNPRDENGHGTHTGGTVGAVSDNGTGVAGVAWSCQLMGLRFLGSGGGVTSDAVLAVEYAVAEGAKVSNNSWGGGGYSQSLYNAINAARSIGHVFCAAAGNNSSGSAIYPAAYDLDNILSVAATNNSDGLAWFSNWHPTDVDLGAPGDTVLSTYRQNGYTYLSGTSMATPHVAGVVAMVYMANPGWTYGQVRDRVLSTTRPIAALNGLCVTGGVVNLEAALAGGGGGSPPATPGRPSIINLTGGMALVQWGDNSTDEDGFELQREERAGSTWTNTTIVGSTPANDDDFLDDPGAGRFRWRVRAYNAAGYSPWSQWRFQDITN